jgi:hypothetical protein
MVASTETMTMMKTHAQLLAGPVAVFLVACGGAPAVHSGYPEGQEEPWTSPEKLNLNDNLEASAEGTISFPERSRARWYVVELPAPGTVTARLNMEPRATGTDVGFEILDAGFNIKDEAEDDNDIGQERKVRTDATARAGRTYIHVFALGRGDKADYRLRLKYEPKPGVTRQEAPSDPTDPRATFPATVPNPPPLAAVAAEAPKTVTRRPAPEPGSEPTRPTPDPPDPIVDPSTPSVRAQIIEFSRSGSGVKILVNKGSDSGVEEGWTGYVVDNATKRSLKGGSFKIRAVRSDESEGVVNVTLDDVQRNRTVVLKPSK